MSLVTHKYTPAEMSDDELQATFAARGHTVDYLVKALRDQIQKGTLSSYVITGPRGAGKSTVIQMVDLRIRHDAELRAAWIPVMFPEEQFGMTSLRDLLAATLGILVKQNIPGAQEWLDKVEAEPDEEQSEQLAVTGLREISQQTGRRFVLFLENLDHLLEDNLDQKMKGTLRRLLMSDAFMLIIGSTVHIFDALKKYDEAFFNYFGQVPLDRLDAGQVSDLLRKRAAYDGNERFLRELPKQQAKVRTLVHLTGGNPRFVLMLYELLSLQQVTTIVQQLKRLVDELTPLLKDEMENLPSQQRKIIHALMERGGTAQPTDLTGSTRLPLNAITTQLKRLKDAQIVEVLGGGKGRAANYTFPDKLFSLWYQMRYLGQNRRRIEMFVEVLRVWFEADERIETLRKLAAAEATRQALLERAVTAEYLAASLRGSAHERAATEMCVTHWVAADLREAAFAYADLTNDSGVLAESDEMAAHLSLSHWLRDQGDYGNMVKALDDVVARPECRSSVRVMALFNRGLAKGQMADAQGELADFTAIVELEGAPKEVVAMALAIRGATKGQLGDAQGALADFTAVVKLEGTPKDLLARTLAIRGVAKSQLGDAAGAIADYTAVIEFDGAPRESIAQALFDRGVAKVILDDLPGAIADYTTVVELGGALRELVVRALLSRGLARDLLGDATGAIADYTAVVELDGVPKESVAEALFNRGVAKGQLGNLHGALGDYTAVVQLEGAPIGSLAPALFNRGLTKGQMGDPQGALADYTAVVQLEGAPVERVSRALLNRGVTKRQLGDPKAALADYTAVIGLEGSPKEQVARALFNRGLVRRLLGDLQGAMADFIEVIRSGVTIDNLMADATVVAVLGDGYEEKQTEDVLGELSATLGRLSNEEALDMTLHLLNTLALPAMKEGWPKVWRCLVAQLKPEVAEAIRFFGPVRSVLEGEDRSLLDALPPEQREFAIEVLTKFESTSETEAADAPYAKPMRPKSSMK